MTEKAQEKSGSKFSGLLAAIKDRNEEDEPARIDQTVAGNESNVDIINGSVIGTKRGRPRGKRSNADFVQVTAYIGKQTHREVKIALLGEEKGREFSELVENLLSEWLKERQ